jgi:hypothetical protein
MSAAAIVIVVITICVAIGLIIWFYVGKNPAQGSTHRTPEPLDTPSEQFYAGSDRPAGPDAEAMATGPGPKVGDASPDPPDWNYEQDRAANTGG